MALVSFGFCFNVLIAWAVGSTSNFILRRVASRLTSFMTGSAPVPVPITSRQHFQGIFSSTDRGVCPKASRNCLDGFFLRLRTVPRSINHVVLVGDAVNTDRTE
jgi:hypothetical protein